MAEVPIDFPLDQVRAELLALPEQELVPITVDVGRASSVVIGALREIRKHRTELITLVGREAARPVDRSELLARALMQAQPTTIWMRRAIGSAAG